MKKILFFFSGIYNGGTEIETYNLLSKLDTKKYELLISYADLQHSDKNMVEKLEQYAKFKDIHSKFEVDTIVYCTEAIDELSTIENNIKYKKSYFWFHYFWEDQEQFLKTVITENKIDEVIAVSNTTRRQLLQFEYLKGKEDKVDTIYNVIDVDKIKEKSKEDIDIELSRELNLLTVSRIAPIKRFDRIEKIAKELQVQNIDFKWLIIGKVKEYEYSDYDEKIKEMLSKYNNIVFIGEKENPFKYMKNVDYTVVLSDRETWSLVITESKVVGTPCLVTDFEAAFEQIEDNKNGLIIKRDNQDYETLVKHMVADKEKLRNNLKQFEYDISSIINKWDEKFK